MAGRPRSLRLSILQPTGWSLNPLSVIVPGLPQRADWSHTLAHVLFGRVHCHAAMSVEREATKLLAATLLMLTEFRDPTLRDLTRLDAVWSYLCQAQAHRGVGGFFGDSRMAIALMADRLVAVKQQQTTEYLAFAGYLGNKKLAISVGEEIAHCALQPLRDFQNAPLRDVLSPGNIEVARLLRDPAAHLVIETDPNGPPAARAVVGLWLGALRMAASAIADRLPLMIAVPDPAAMGRIEFQSGNADLV